MLLSEHRHTRTYTLYSVSWTRVADLSERGRRLINMSCITLTNWCRADFEARVGYMTTYTRDPEFNVLPSIDFFNRMKFWPRLAQPDMKPLPDWERSDSVSGRGQRTWSSAVRRISFPARTSDFLIGTRDMSNAPGREDYPLAQGRCWYPLLQFSERSSVPSLPLAHPPLRSTLCATSVSLSALLGEPRPDGSFET